jgi:hypothetical protein
MMKHKYYYLFAIFIIIDTVFAVLAARNEKVLQQKPQKNVRTDPALAVAPPVWTGGKDEPFVVTDADKEHSDLLSRLPFSNVSFSISMDYKRDIFIVLINDPYDANVTQFKTWLKNNHFDLIPVTKFKYLNVSQ